MLECMREYFEGKAERLQMKIRKLCEVGYEIDDISSILGLPEEIVEVVLR